MIDKRGVEKRKKFLSDMFTGAPVERHGFLVKGGVRRRAWEIGDFATSDRPLKEFLPYVLETYQTGMEYFELPGNDWIPMIDLNYGTHVFAVACGAKPVFPTKSSPYAEAMVLSAAEADKFEEPKVEDSRPLMRVIEMAKMAQAELGPEAITAPPNLQTGFDIACILWDKTDLYCSLCEAPDSVRRFTDKCTRLLVSFLKLFRHECPNSSLNGYAWSPLGPLVSNDECGNMNTEMFETFCLPSLLDLSKEFGSVAMHCCANARHQFELFRKIPNFYAFNRVPTKKGWEEDNAMETLGGPSGPVMIPLASSDTIPLMLQKAPSGTRFVFLDLGAASVDEARRWLDESQTAAERR